MKKQKNQSYIYDESYWAIISKNDILDKNANIKKICIKYLLREITPLGLNHGMFSVKYLIENCNYKEYSGRTNIKHSFIEILNMMIENDELFLDTGYEFPCNNVKHGIAFIINLDKMFNGNDGFVKLTKSEFDILIRNNSKYNRESMLHVYLYIKSFNFGGSKCNGYAGFCHSINIISENTGISKRVVVDILQDLTDMNLLRKYVVGSVKFVDAVGNHIRNVPNIYIPNTNQKDEVLDEIVAITVDKLKEHYHVKEFLPFLKYEPEV